jgi:hypothetical protein
MAGRGARRGTRTRANVHGPLARGEGRVLPVGAEAHLADAVGALTRRRARWNRPSRSPGRRTSNGGALRPYRAQPTSFSDGGPASGLEPRIFVAHEGRLCFFSLSCSIPGDLSG